MLLSLSSLLAAALWPTASSVIFPTLYFKKLIICFSLICDEIEYHNLFLNAIFLFIVQFTEAESLLVFHSCVHVYKPTCVSNAKLFFYCSEFGPFTFIFVHASFSHSWWFIFFKYISKMLVFSMTFHFYFLSIIASAFFWHYFNLYILVFLICSIFSISFLTTSTTSI